jgi:hypothetical protein
MWEEDPRVQNAYFKILLIILAIFSAVFTSISVLKHDWQIAKYYFAFLATLLAASCIYAALVWTFCNVVVLVGRLLRKQLSNNKR